MEGIARHLRAIWRAERIVAELRLGRALRRAGLLAVALVGVALGSVMLNVAAFLALRDVVGDALAALAVAGADLAAAGIAGALAMSRDGGRDLDLAIELRAAALTAVAEDARRLGTAGAGLRRIAALMLRRPLGAGLSIIASAVLAALLRRRGDPAS